jgi:hypothetical protein
MSALFMSRRDATDAVHTAGAALAPGRRADVLRVRVH